MIKNVLSLVLVACMALSISAQQLTHPMEFVVNSPTSVAGAKDYGYQVDWGPTSISTTCGDLAWGYTAAGDSVGCDPIVTDLTGKIAMISRGGCNFSLKAYHAQQAGAIGTIIINVSTNPPADLVNMLGGDSMTAVTTPAVFLGYGDGSALAAEVNAGNTVNACFKVPVIGGAQGINHYSTPLSQVYPLDTFWLTAYNNGTAAETNVTLIVDIEEPDGTVNTYSNNWGTVGAGSEQQISVASGFIPTQMGTHSVTYKLTSDAGTYNNESVSQEFETTTYTFANDNKNDGRGGVVIAGFDTDLRYGVGNFYYPSAQTVATHASFALDNVTTMHGEFIVVTLYDTDVDLNGVLDGGNYTDFSPVGFNTITIDSTLYSDGDTILVELISPTGMPISLNAGGAYLIGVDYDAFTSPNGNLNAPSYVHSFEVGYNTDNTLKTIVSNSDALSQWSAGIGNALVRLHLDGYVSGTEDVKLLDEASFTMYPNPATKFVTLDLNLEEMSKDVNVKILDINGRELQNFNYANIQSNKYQYSVENLPAGTYFLRVQTDEGFRTKHFIVIK